MTFEFEELELHGIGRSTGNGDLMWSTLEIAFRETETGVTYRAEAKIFVPRRADMTFSEIQREARERAIALFKEAANCLEANDIPSLESKRVQS